MGTPITATSRAASKFLADAGVCLRYRASASVALPSLVDFADGDRESVVLANELIERGDAIEVNCVADRVCLAHKTFVPALYALARRDVMVTMTARQVFEFLKSTPRPTAGMVRTELGVPPKTWPNAADDALAELQRFMLIDRGAVETPATGIAYLPKDGIPYRIFDDVHRVKKLAPSKAISTLLEYFELPTAKKLFKRIVRKDEWPKIK